MRQPQENRDQDHYDGGDPLAEHPGFGGPNQHRAESAGIAAAAVGRLPGWRTGWRLRAVMSKIVAWVAKSGESAYRLLT